MILKKLIRSGHGRSAMAEYVIERFRLTVYLRHNHPCKVVWGHFCLTCYLRPKKDATEENTLRFEFNSYAFFREFRRSLPEIVEAL